MKWPPSLTLIALALSLLSSRALQAASSCERLLDPRAEARAIVSALDASLPGRTVINSTTLDRVDGAGASIGSLFYLNEGFQGLYVESMMVLPGNRGVGLSRLLSAQALLREPHVRYVQAQLANSNARAFYEFLERLPMGPAHSESLAHRLALEATPFYKVFRSLGFSRIEYVEPRAGSVNVGLALEDGLR